MGILRADVVSHSQLEPTGSVLLDGNSDYLSWSNTSLKLGTSDFTLEAWIYVVDENSGDLHQTIFMAGDSSDAGEMVFQVCANNAGTLGAGAARELAIRVAGTGYFSYYQIEYGQWYHVACVRTNGVIDFYVDGTHTGKSVAVSENLTTAFTQIGYRDGSYNAYFNGYISNARISFGALYKNNFTLSKFELENVAGTALLCCQSSTSATTAAVIPSAITANGTAAASAVIPDVKKDITDAGVVLEDNTKFDTLSYMVPPGGTTAESNRGRGLIAGHYDTPQVNTISYINIQSEGNAINFGDLVSGAASAGCFASSTRGVWCGGYYGPAGTVSDTIQYVTIATQGNAIDSTGNLLAARKMIAGLSNDTRGVNAGGTAPSSADNVMQYVTIASLGNASDFGDLTAAAFYPSAAGNTTRGIIYLGSPAPNTASNVIDYITIATTGNASDFGDATYAAQYRGGLAASSSTRLVNGGGFDAPLNSNVIDYITIATTGNATDFGDLTRPQHGGANMSNSIRGVFAGAYGQSPAQYSNSIEYVTIATTGNASDFGDIPNISGNSSYTAGCSDSHGGIS